MRGLQEVLLALPGYGGRRAIGVRGDFGCRWWSYAEMYELALRAASLLALQGLRTGDKVVLWSGNSPEWVACLLGAALRGVVVVPVDSGATQREVTRTGEGVAAKLTLCGQGQEVAGLGLAATRMSDLGRMEARTFDELRVEVGAEDVAAILFTAGSSGDPRGVLLTHGNLASQMEHFWYWRPVVRIAQTRLLALSPLSHVQGLMLSACVPLSLGLTVIYTGSIEPEHLVRSVREEGVRVLSTVPRVLAGMQQFLEEQEGAGWGLRRRFMGLRFRVVLVGGATLPERQERFWRGIGCVVVQGYGSTETAAFCTVNRPLVGRRGSIGKVVHGGSVKLSDEGEILVRGPHLSPGYFGEDENGGDKRTVDGYLRTGDLARTDRWGRMYFLGRLGDRIVTAEGHTIYPDRIEAALKDQPGVQDAVVLAVERQGLEEVHAVVVGDRAGVGRAVLEANRGLQDAERIRSWAMWPGEDFPRGALGKPRREWIAQATRERLLRVADGEGEGAVEMDTLERAVEDPDRSRRLKRVGRLVKEMKEEKSFAGLVELLTPLGLDSVDVAEVMTLLGGVAAVPWEVGVKVAPRTSAPLRSPRWQWWPGAAGWRRAVRWALLGNVWRGVRQRSRGLENLPEDGRAVLFALHGDDRKHWVENVAILRALPRRYRDRLMPTIGDAGHFAAYYTRRAEDRPLWRWYIAFMVRVGVPSMVPYILAPRGTAELIRGNCQALAEGFSGLLTWNRAAATAACEMGATVVPVRIQGERTNWYTGEFALEFGKLVQAQPGMDAVQFERRVMRQLETMEQERMSDGR